MIGYVAGFTVYTMAMLGVIFIAFIVAKKFMNAKSSNNANFLTIESRLNIEPRKNLYVVKAGNERFLISTDTDGSRFLTKLNDNNSSEISEIVKPQLSEKLEEVNIPVMPQINSISSILESKPKKSKSVMRGILEKLDSPSFAEFI